MQYLEVVGIIIGQVLVGIIGDWLGRRWGLLQDCTIMLLGLIMLTAAWGIDLSTLTDFPTTIPLLTVCRWLGRLLCYFSPRLRRRCRWRVSHDCDVWYGKRGWIRQGLDQG